MELGQSRQAMPNYVWVINCFIAYKGVIYTRCLTIYYQIKYILDFFGQSV